MKDLTLILQATGDPLAFHLALAL